MNIRDEILESFEDNGFFYNLRAMKFSSKDAESFVRKLQDIDVGVISDGDKLDILVILWKLPFFAATYKERCIEKGATRKDYAAFVNSLYEIVESKIALIAEAIKVSQRR